MTQWMSSLVEWLCWTAVALGIVAWIWGVRRVQDTASSPAFAKKRFIHEPKPVLIWLVQERASALFRMMDTKWNGMRPKHSNNKNNPLYDRVLYGGELRGSCCIKYHGQSAGGDHVAEFIISIRGPVPKLQQRMAYLVDLSEEIKGTDLTQVMNAINLKETEDLRQRLFSEIAPNSRLFGRV